MKRVKLGTNRSCSYILKKTIDLTASGDSFARFSLERMRNLMGINSQPWLQLKSTIDFFTQYPELYILPEYQVLFEKLMMEPALMQDQLHISAHDSELFILSLKNFCDTKLELFKKYYDYKNIAFTLHMKQLFYQQALFAKVEPNTVKILAGAPEELFAVIQELKPEQLSERSFLYRNLAEMFLYSETLSAQDVGLLLLAMIEFKSMPQQDSEYLDRFAEKSIQNILIKQHENIKQAINDDSLDFIVKILRPDVSRTLKDWKDWRIVNYFISWTHQDAIYSARFGTTQFQIDILNGQFYDGGNARVLFPIDAVLFKKVYGESAQAPSHAVNIGIDTYEWPDGKAQKNGASWTFQKKIKNAWYQYLDEADLKNLGDTKIIIPGYQYWRSIETQAGTPTTLDVYSADNKQAYQAEISGDKIKSFKRSKDGAVLIDTGSSYRVFGQIEDWKHIYIWQNSDTKQVIEIELPRLHLIFKAISHYIECADNKDYKVAEKQYATELGDPVNYLVCDLISDPQDTNKKIILMPPSKLGPSLQEIFNEGSLSVTQFVTTFDSNHVLIYETDLASGLSPTTEESRYYLALRKLFQREYRSAAQEIRNTSIELKPLEPDEQKVVSWLIDGNLFDSDPRSYAVRLLAAYWKSKHEQYYLGIFKPVSEELYRKYLENIGRIDTSILGIFE